MSRVCELTGIKPLTGNKVSHSNRKSRKRWLPNLKKKKYFIEPLSSSLTLTLSTRAIRSVDKIGGIVPAVLKAKEDNLSDRLKRVRRRVQAGK